MQNMGLLNWRFDVNAFRLLGRELITDRITALVELVKNSYDANATEVFVEFHNVGEQLEQSKIVIRDNGLGMSFEDVKNKWMVVGTNSKRVSQFSPIPFKRKFIGEKGIGRFAVDKLGSYLLMITKSENSKEELCVKINWEKYEKLAGDHDGQLKLFTEVGNQYQFKESTPEKHGTKLIITKVNDVWTKHDIDRAYKELSKIISPFHPINPPFKILVYSNEYEKEYKNKPVTIDKVMFASNEFSLNFDEEEKVQETLAFDKTKGEMQVKRIPKPSFGLVKMKVFYFDESAKRKFNAHFKKGGRNIDGIKIYRDGILTTPFAEYEANTYKQRDILGIDKRLWQSTYDRIGTREVIGIMDISKLRNPEIREATNRQDFIDNCAYRDLKEFIIHQLEEIGNFKVYMRGQKKKNAVSTLNEVNKDVKKAVKEFREYTKNVRKNNPLLVPVLDQIESKISQASSAVQTVVKVSKQVEKEAQRKENLYLSLMSLQDYAANLSHAVRTSLGKIKRLAEFFKNEFPNPKYEELFSKYSLRIYDEINTLGRVVDFMLSYAKAALVVEEFSIKQIIENLFQYDYQHVFKAEGIKALVEIQDDFILNGNKKFFEDIFENLISNSVKSLENTSNKIIKCSGGIEDNGFVCYFSDNGQGINRGDEEKIYEIYYTTTAEKGGAGLGLYIVKKRIEALKGTIEVIESEFSPKGATFKINLPFKK